MPLGVVTVTPSTVPAAFGRRDDDDLGGRNALDGSREAAKLHRRCAGPGLRAVDGDRGPARRGTAAGVRPVTVGNWAAAV